MQVVWRADPSAGDDRSRDLPGLPRQHREAIEPENPAVGLADGAVNNARRGLYAEHSLGEPAMNDVNSNKNDVAGFDAARGSADWQPNANEKRYLECIVGMSVDSLTGRGVKTKETYITNLRGIANCLESVVPPNDPSSATRTAETQE